MIWLIYLGIVVAVIWSIHKLFNLLGWKWMSGKKARAQATSPINIYLINHHESKHIHLNE